MSEAMRSHRERIADQRLALQAGVAAMREALGQPTGIGCQDRAPIDLPGLRAAEERFVSLLEDYQKLEAATAGGRDPYEADHRELRGMVELLRAVTNTSDGACAYPIRTILARVAEDLEHCLAKEGRQPPPRILGPRA